MAQQMIFSLNDIQSATGATGPATNNSTAGLGLGSAFQHGLATQLGTSNPDSLAGVADATGASTTDALDGWQYAAESDDRDVILKKQADYSQADPENEYHIVPSRSGFELQFRPKATDTQQVNQPAGESHGIKASQAVQTETQGQEAPAAEPIADKDSLEYNLLKNTRAGGSKEIAELYSFVEHTPAPKKEAIRYAIVSELEAEKLKGDTGLELAGYHHSVDNIGLRHAAKNHGINANETSRGQMPITAEDVAKIPEIVATYDTAKHVGKDQSGNELIQYSKRYNGTTYYVEEVRTGRMELMTKTMWKTPTAQPAAAEAGLALTPEAYSGNFPHGSAILPPAVNSGASEPVEQGDAPLTFMNLCDAPDNERNFGVEVLG